MKRSETAQLIYDYKVKIIECKKKLKATDYKALKFAEGEISEDDYAIIRAERRTLRAEINYYECEISILKGTTSNN